MLTWHTSSEEEKILYLRKFAQNIRNDNEGPQLLEDCENVVPRFQISPILPFPPHPPDWSLNPLEETLLQPMMESFITVFIVMRG